MHPSFSALLFLVASLAGGCAAFGHRASGERLAVMKRSPEWDHGHFVNPQPMEQHLSAVIAAMFHTSPDVRPRGPLPVAPVPASRFAAPPPSGLRVTWFGHSSTLVEIDGQRILTDPIWSHRAAPYSSVGPKRWYGPLIPLAELPPIDAVVISHDHYDHLDYGTIRAMKRWGTRFIVPLGVGARLAGWGIPDTRITELDWWQRARLGDLEIVCVPARHASGRSLTDRDATLWSGWALVGRGHRVYYSGDTGLFPAQREIGSRLGPFDLAMIEVGQYNRAWPDWHSGPEQSVHESQLVRAKLMLPVHWALFALAAHAWTEPIERAIVAAQKLGVNLVAPRPGQSFEPLSPPRIERWWPTVPWHTAEQDPIRSTRVP